MATLPRLPTMANVWDGTIMQHPPNPPAVLPEYPGWLSVCCGCCAGVEWGGEYPIECRECGGSGQYFVHAATGTGALYPGGPFNGWKFDPDDAERWLQDEAAS